MSAMLDPGDPTLAAVLTSRIRHHRSRFTEGTMPGSLRLAYFSTTTLDGLLTLNTIPEIQLISVVPRGNGEMMFFIRGDREVLQRFAREHEYDLHPGVG